MLNIDNGMLTSDDGQLSVSKGFHAPDFLYYCIEKHMIDKPSKNKDFLCNPCPQIIFRCANR